MDQPKRKPARKEAWAPPERSVPAIAAIQALARGDAEPGQQQFILRWIVEELSRAYDVTFHPGGSEGDRETAFAEGRRFVGVHIATLTKLDLSILRRTERE